MDAAETVEPAESAESVEATEPGETREPEGTREPVEAGAVAARADVMPSADGPVLDGIPRQPGAAPVRKAVREAAAPVRVAGDESPQVTGRQPVTSLNRSGVLPAWLRPWRLSPTPTGTPFTFFYATVLVVTSAVAEYADPALVQALHRGSSTDVAHLVRDPVLVLSASALWVAGGIASPYVLGFLVVLTALERRIGGWRTAGVFLLGHALATLATEVPVGLAVLAGHLPASSLHRLDYGISFGVAASAGALAGLLPPWLRWPMLLGFGAMLVDDLMAFTDPMTNWGHLLSLAIGVATWPVVRRWYAGGGGRPGPPGPGRARARARLRPPRPPRNRRPPPARRAARGR
ncbi:rhomboid-like protein [Streptomyces sp. NPDC012510]|uniref:rhomboid-like protein n=1 Tax=Streptomyces sp. NPDC012510 TaxID=3364838 RepID=UPI0036E0C7F0